MNIRAEAPGDVPAREALLDRSFGRARFRKTCERLRRGRLPAEGLAFSATQDGVLVGTVRLWQVDAGSAGPALMLGPIAVAPELRGQGLGKALMTHALASAAALGHRAVVLVGDAPYYARFGFSGDVVGGLALPGPVDRARFLGLEIVPGALAEAQGLIVPTGRLLPARKTARAA